MRPEYLQARPARSSSDSSSRAGDSAWHGPVDAQPARQPLQKAGDPIARGGAPVELTDQQVPAWGERANTRFEQSILLVARHVMQ
jgi:hypothetical protein